MGKVIIEHARETGIELPPQLNDADAELTPDQIVDVLRHVAWHYFPSSHPTVPSTPARPATAEPQTVPPGLDLKPSTRFSGHHWISAARNALPLFE
jgi:hypothetical protein